MSSRLPPGWKLPTSWKPEDVVTIEGLELGYIFGFYTGTYRGTVEGDHGVFTDETQPAGCVPTHAGRSVLCRLHKIIEGAAGVRAECCDRIDGAHLRLFIRRGGEGRPQGVDRRWGGG